jgi:ComF family protein
MTTKTTWSRRFWRLVLPVECVGCSLEHDWLCPDCLAALPISRTDRCCLCGKAGHDGLCDACRSTTKLDGIISLFSYAEPGVQRLIKEAKYRGHADALGFFAAAFGARILRALPPGDWQFSFVPTTTSRSLERGFNQSELLARLLAEREHPVQAIFRKTRETPAQASLTKKERATNLKGAFELARPPKDRLVICDDVVTTGATLEELAKLAKKAGAKEVWAITIAHG